MGSLNALGFAEQVEEGNISLTAAVSWHLSSNHYPPVPSFMVPVAVAAIEAGQDEDWDRDVDLPLGCQTHKLIVNNEGVCPGVAPGVCELEAVVQWRDREDGKARAGDVIESFHLDSFVFSFNDPTVACCGRDAADCDCPETAVCEQPFHGVYNVEDGCPDCPIEYEPVDMSGGSGGSTDR